MATAEYQRNWRKRNPELNRAARARQRKNSRGRKRKHNAHVRAWVKATTASQRRQARGIIPPSLQPEAVKARSIARRGLKRCPMQKRIQKQRRRARKGEGWVALSKSEKARVVALYREARGRPGYVVDHIVPLARGGLHHPDNLRVIGFLDNSRKGDRLDHELKCPMLMQRLIAADPILQ